MSGVPEIKASYLRANLDAVKRLGDDVDRRVRLRLGPTVALIEAASRIAWLPCTLDVDLSQAIADEAGIAAVREVNKLSFVANFRGPLLAPILGAATRLFGLTPRSIMRVTNPVWAQATRNAGHLKVPTAGEHGATVVWEGAPAALLTPAYVAGFLGVFDGAIAAVGAFDGDVARLPDQGPGELRIQMTWRPRAAR